MVFGSGGPVHAECDNYEPTGKIGRMTHQNGAQTDYVYYGWSTRLKQIQTTSSGTIQNREYFYTDAGDVERIVDHQAGITYDYGYDDLHRLVSEYSYGAYPAINYAYNAIGNMTSRTIGSTVYTYSYDDPDHKDAVSMINVNAQNHYFSYDDNGNMTTGKDLTDLGQIADRTIQWNADNMPVSITHSAHGTTSFTYDGNNARVKKVNGSTATYYFGPDFEIKTQGGSPDYIKYIFAGNLRVAKVSSQSGTHYFHKDHLGSSTAMTNSGGSVSETTEYRPFGSQRAHTGSILSSYKFTDQEMDPESGLYNYKARLYDPVIGRFINADSIVPDMYNPQHFNKYSYCYNNPLKYIDPNGHFGIVGGIVGGFSGVVSGAIAGYASGGNVGSAIFGGAIGGLAGGLAGAVLGPVGGQIGSKAATVAITAAKCGISSIVGGAGGRGAAEAAKGVQEGKSASEILSDALDAAIDPGAVAQDFTSGVLGGVTGGTTFVAGASKAAQALAGSSISRAANTLIECGKLAAEINSQSTENVASDAGSNSGDLGGMDFGGIEAGGGIGSGGW